jgi:hypothetical protein
VKQVLFSLFVVVLLVAVIVPLVVISDPYPHP